MAFERVSRLASIPALFLLTILWLVTAGSASAITLLRDPDIENGLEELAFPILRAAGLNPRRIKLLVVDDSSLNAFVLDHNAIFIHSGLIEKVQRADVLQAVIAHEAAHIANGHIARRIGNLENARTLSRLGLGLSLLAAAAGGGEAAMGIAAGTQSSALRGFLKHTRAEETAADNSAVSYLRWSDISIKGLIDLHRTFAGQELLSVERQDPYMQSHPLTRDRIRSAETYLESYGDQAPANPDADYWFARVRGKVSAFSRSSKWTLGRAAEEHHRDIRMMREAIAWHRDRNLAQARAAIDAAIAERPDDAYYVELKGQILIEHRQTQAAVATYKQAVDLAPNNALILAGYGRALLGAGQDKAALEVLERARARDYRDIRMLRDLAVAYSKTGNDGMASVVTAERYALQGRPEDALIHARRAVGALPTGSPGWQRAQDVLLASERSVKRKR
ncbi:Putative Zn-dependent protease, contains TPR repeats [Ruegeria marina]|uniref:Putative Zn-dependent protease, contains TPR repeats n=2 Tax=Ruegeria marina TaxID=639004 RepID=A0A1G6QBE8_9RHOB|nr:Putative Zn-dependent protease, contains TPR repeats [Ruegeria marina]